MGLLLLPLARIRLIIGTRTFRMQRGTNQQSASVRARVYVPTRAQWVQSISIVHLSSSSSLASPEYELRENKLLQKAEGLEAKPAKRPAENTTPWFLVPTSFFFFFFSVWTAAAQCFQEISDGQPARRWLSFLPFDREKGKLDLAEVQKEVRTTKDHACSSLYSCNYLIRVLYR